jgi:MarR family transcriptional regulator, organic hydroperoxide resistance regulator
VYSNHWGTNDWYDVSVTATAQDPLALDRQVCFALAVAAREVVALYRPVLEQLGLTHPQYLVMLALWERDPRSLRDLAGTLALDPGTLSPLVKRLEAAGLVQRARDRVDERLLAVTLTAAGRRLRRQALTVPEQIVARLGLPLAELEQLNAALRTVIAAAGTPGGTAGAVGTP